jgi:single-stranded DNA-binding protein
MSERTNFVFLKGRLYNYTETVTKTGKTISRFSLRVVQGKDATDAFFVSVDAWNLNENLRNMLNQNQGKVRVAVQGQFRQDTWTDKATGSERKKFKINADVVSFLELVKASEPAAPTPTPAPEPTPNDPVGTTMEVPF